MGETFGLPLHCPRCPSKHYYGILKGENSLSKAVKPGRSDVCPNCKTRLVPSNKVPAVSEDR